MCQAYNAGQSGYCLETFVGNGKLSLWTRKKVRECYNEDRATCRKYALIATEFRSKITSSGSLLDMERSNATGGVRRPAGSTFGRP